MIIDRSALYNMIVIYDGVEQAERMAESMGGKAKHSDFRHHHPFKTFSVIITPTDKNHKNPREK